MFVVSFSGITVLYSLMSNTSWYYPKCLVPEVFGVSYFFGFWNICIILTDWTFLIWKAKIQNAPMGSSFECHVSAQKVLDSEAF